MKKPILLGILALAPALFMGGLAVAQTGNVQSLRGADADVPLAVKPVPKQVDGRLPRNYRQQPPLVPHEIDKYQIDTRTNQCLACHDWTRAGERNAPTLSMTHYLDRNGNELDHIAGTRYFCNQCHVPQADAPALVDNVFQPSTSR